MIVRQANTIKFLIACTPGGSISYVSAGYPGSIGDMDLTDCSGVLELLGELDVVLADKGFEILNLVNKHKAGSVILPPRKVANVPFTPEQSAETTKIAKLRIHIERCVQILRRWSFITREWPYSSWPQHSSAVQVAAFLTLFSSKPARSVPDSSHRAGRRQETRVRRAVHPNQCMGEGLVPKELLIRCLDLAEERRAQDRAEEAARQVEARRVALGNPEAVNFN